MKYTKLSINSKESQEDFEYVRWHVINHILNQGDIAARSPLTKGRNRPESYKEEFATVMFDKGFYTFYVEPRSTTKNRNLQIVVGSIDKDDLGKRVSELIKNTKLKEG